MLARHVMRGQGKIDQFFAARLNSSSSSGSADQSSVSGRSVLEFTSWRREKHINAETKTVRRLKVAGCKEKKSSPVTFTQIIKYIPTIVRDGGGGGGGRGT